MPEADTNPGTSLNARRWLRWLGGSLLLFAALVGMSLWALSNHFDRERIVAMVAVEVKKATGRDIHVDGAIGFHLRPSLALQISGVRFGNSAWGTKPDMLKVRHIELDVALRPLLDKRLEIKRVLLDGVEVWLETDAQGQGNWVMQGEAKSPAPATPPEAAGAPLVIDLEQLDIVDSTVSLHDGRSGRNEAVTLARFTLRGAGTEDRIEAQLRFRDQPIAVKGMVGTYAALVAGNERFPFDVVLTLEGSEFSAKGDVGLGAQSGTAKVEVGAAVQKTSALSALTGSAFTLPLGLPLPMQFSGHIEQTATAIALPAFKLVLAGQAVAGQLRYEAGDAKAAGRPKLTGAISADVLDLGALIPKTAAAPAPAAKAGKPAKVFSAAALPLPALPALDVQLELSTAQLRFPGKPAAQGLAALHTSIRVQGDTVEARPLTFKLAGGAVSAAATLRLPAGAGAPSFKLQVNADGIALDQALALTGNAHGVSGGRSELRLDLGASGATAHQLASNLNGEVRLSVGPAHLGGDLAGLGGDVLTRLVEAVNPFRKQDKGSDLRCAALRLPIKQGKIVIDHSIAMESDKLDVVASGEIDLGAETLAMAFRPAVKQGLGVGAMDLAQLVKLRGTLSQPVIAADLQGATREVASISAAVATGGLSLIGERLLKEKRDPHPCVTALGGARAGVDAAAEQGTAKSVAKMADKVTSGVSGLFRSRGQR